MQKRGSSGSGARRGVAGTARQPPKTRLAMRRAAAAKPSALKAPQQKKGRGSRAPAPGGARVGAGRRALYGDEKLDEKVSTRYSGEQARHLYEYCQKNRVNPNLFMREAALKRAGLAKLGIGLSKAFNTLRADKVLPVPPEDGLQLPVKCTLTQKKGIAAYCRSMGVDEGTFVRESSLKEAELGHLTVAAQHRDDAAVLDNATGK